MARNYTNTISGSKRFVQIGEQISHLTVLRQTDSINRRRAFVCGCICGSEVVRSAHMMVLYEKTSSIQSCGCMGGAARAQMRERVSESKQRHGLARRGSKHPGHTCWMNMKRRCTDPTNRAYKYYGGRGITVCERWLVSFENFWADMGPTWQAGLSIDRTNNDGYYTPDNCRWATPTEQANNQRRRLLPRGALSILAKATGVSYHTLYRRFKQGVPVSELHMTNQKEKQNE